METKHTKGEWSFQDLPAHNRYGIYSNESEFLAVAFYQKTKAEAEANAKLICAAPQLLESLIEAQKLIEVVRQYMPKSIKNTDKFHFENISANVINKAINKATI